MDMTLKPIGIIHSPFKEPAGMPIQPALAKGARGRVEVFPEFQEGLMDIEGFERIWLLYWFHKAKAPRLRLKPFLEDVEHGLFTTRAPCRPNPIGVSPVGLVRVEENILHVCDIDIMDGTPLVDIKPYAPRFDCFEVTRSGWLDRHEQTQRHSDDRFSQA